MAPEVLSRFRAEVEAESYGVPKTELEVERDIRAKADAFYYEVFTRTQSETTKRWTYEAEIKRPYFHVTELENHQLINWRKYLDFEEEDGDYARIVALYERCLVTCAFYDEFWFRYARWMSAQPGKAEEVRNIYLRATTLFVPISRPGIRLQFAYFEEMSGRADIARDIHAAVLNELPESVETITSWANLERRQKGLDAAIEVYKAQIDSPRIDIFIKAALVTDWAFLLWKTKGSSTRHEPCLPRTCSTTRTAGLFGRNGSSSSLSSPPVLSKRSNMQCVSSRCLTIYEQRVACLQQ